MRCFLDPRRVGAVVCCPRRVSLCRMQLPEDCLGPSVRRGLGAERPSCLRGHGWGLGAEGFTCPILIPHEEEPVGSGFRAPETSSKAAGPKEPGQPSPGSPYGERAAGSQNGLHRFLDPRHVGAVLCCLRRVSLCRMQLTEDCLGPSVRRGLDADRTSWLRGHGWGLGAEGFPRPILINHEGEPVGSGFRARGTPAKQQGPGSRGSPALVRPMESGGSGAKTACVAFSIRGALGLWFAA